MMKKTILTFLFIICYSTMELYAQVGMPTNSPDQSAALDMKANTDKGLLIPNVNLTTTANGNVVKGGVPAQSLLVYNTNANVSGTGAGGTGYYYWDTNIWKKLVTASDVPTASANTAWNTAGTTNDAGGDKIGSINRTGRVGIGLTGTNVPSTLLHVNSTNAGAIKIVDGTQGDGRILTSDANGLATWQTRAPKAQTATGVIPTGEKSWTGVGFRYTGFSIQVPAGKSVLTAGMIVKATANGYFTCRLSYSATTMSDFASEATPKYSGFTLVNSTSAGQVVWYIDNPSPSPLTLYIWGGAGGNAGPGTITLGGSALWAETFILCAY